MSAAKIPFTIEEVLEPTRSALVIWDMQVGIAGRAYNSASLLPAVQALVSAARARNVLVCWSKHVAPRPADLSPALLRTQMRIQKTTDIHALKPIMQAGTRDIEFVDGLAPQPGELVIEKSFPSLFLGTPFDFRLRAHNIQTIVLCGVATEHGVVITARTALAYGYFVVIAEEAVGSYSEAGNQLGLSFLRHSSGPDVVPNSTITAAWGQ